MAKAKIDNSVKIALIVSATILLLGLLGYSMLNRLLPASDTIITQGNAEIKAVPDVIGIYFNVETNASTATEAKNANSEIVNSLKEAITELGFEKEDLKTQNFNVYPDYQWEDGKTVNNGFKAVHSLKIELENEEQEKAGEVIDAGVNSGALISYINFELSLKKQNVYKAEALNAATQDAKTKAEAIAEGLGKNLGKVISVSDSSFNYYPWPLLRSDKAVGATEAKEAITSISPSEQTISASVTASYKIK